MIYQIIKEEQELMIAGAFPQRYRDKNRTGDECFEVFRKDYLKSELAYCEFLAAWNLWNNKSSQKQVVTDPKEGKKTNPKLAFFKIRSSKTNF